MLQRSHRLALTLIVASFFFVLAMCCLEIFPPQPTLALEEGAVDTRLEFVELTYSDAQTGTLIFDMQARSSSGTAFPIRTFQNSLLLDPTFSEHLITMTFTRTFSTSSIDGILETSDPVTRTDWNGEWVRLIYQEIQGLVISSTDWSTLVRVGVVFTQTPTEAAVNWNPDPYPPIFYTSVYSDGLAVDVTGEEFAIPEEFQNIPLAPPAVDLRMTFVDLQYHNASTGTLIFDVEAQSWDGLPHMIRALQSTFVLSGALGTQLSSVDFDDHFFPEPAYRHIENIYDIDARWHLGWYIYEYEGGEMRTITDTNWHKITRVSVNFTQTQGIGHVLWYEGGAPFDGVSERLPEGEERIRQIMGDRHPLSDSLTSFPLSESNYLYLPLLQFSQNLQLKKGRS